MTKQEKVLQHLKQFGAITSWDAINEYGATRLSAIIFNLRKQGYDITSEKKDFIDRFTNRTLLSTNWQKTHENAYKWVKTW